MNKHDKREIEKLKQWKEDFKKWSKLPKEERIKQFLKEMRGPRPEAR